MPTFRSFRLEAVVLRHSDLGEADRLLVLFTPQRGKLRAVAKGVRKVTSRKAGHLEPFTRVSLQLAEGRDLPIITQAETLDAYLPLREDLQKLSQAAYAIELIDRFLPEDEQPQPELYRLLVQSLERIAASADPWAALRFFDLRLLDGLGFRPRLFECVSCGEPLRPQDQFFSFSAGGVICTRCGQNTPNLTPLSLTTLKYLRHFQRASWGEVAIITPSPAARREVEALLQGYWTYLLERELNAPRVWRQLRRE
ncbi:MAG: DNA repair protein RecO [Anaerolineales bacterium]